MDNPHAEVEIKPQLKPRGSVTKEEDPNLPTSCTSCRLNPHDQLGRLFVYGIYKSTLRAPTEENALVLIAVDVGAHGLEWLPRNGCPARNNMSRPAHPGGAVHVTLRVLSPNS